jgi:hypothetical protein
VIERARRTILDLLTTRIDAWELPTIGLQRSHRLMETTVLVVVETVTAETQTQTRIPVQTTVS